jgi:FkbM family methyltransferase
LDYPLNEDSVVLDLGGYHGDFANNIYSKFNCNVYVFEPYAPFYNMINERFKDNEKIRVFDYGISNQTSDVEFFYSNDGSSLANVKKYSESDNKDISIVKIKSFHEVYKELNLDVIDLLKINVEGAEYEIIENIFDNGYTKKIKNFQIQFHPEPPGSEESLERIREEFSKTHKQDWNYQWVWENWSLK